MAINALADLTAQEFLVKYTGGYQPHVTGTHQTNISAGVASSGEPQGTSGNPPSRPSTTSSTATATAAASPQALPASSSASGPTAHDWVTLGVN